MKTCIKCGSHAFNLYVEKIDQGGLCDVHYWQGRAHRAEAQPEQEPSITKTGCGILTLHVGFDDLPDGTKFYTTPPKRPWVGLTDADWEPLYDKFAKHQEYGAFVSGWDNFARAIDAKLEEKNT